MMKEMEKLRLKKLKPMDLQKRYPRKRRRVQMMRKANKHRLKR